MGEIGQPPSHLVKVDNWPLFFLQRLHHFYRKKSHCDLTLLFSTLDTVKSIKVHKLVLHACTDYFDSLDVKQDSEHGEFLQLSNEMHPDVIIPIISFMYTGKLEFPVTLQPKLYEAATKLRMTILTKLLDVQPNKGTKKINQLFEEAASKGAAVEKDLSLGTPNVVENNQDIPVTTIVSNEISQTVVSPSSSKPFEESIIKIIPTIVPLQNKQNFRKDITIVQSDKTNNQLKAKLLKNNVSVQLTAVSTKSKPVEVTLPPTLPGRKLPIWKRKVPFTGSQIITDNVQNVYRRGIFKTEIPKPTRFEWDEDLEDPTLLKPVEDAPKILSHDRTPKIIYPVLLEEVKQDEVFDSLKRSYERSSSESPPYKRSKSDLQDMKEYGKQQQLRNEIICSEENLDDMADADDIYGPCDEESNDLLSFNASTPKPILKTVTKPDPPVSSKRVRFSLEGKENNQQQPNESSSELTSTKEFESPVIKQKIIVPMDVSQMESEKHHVKIVSEVLKKYPNLATKDNIKLRVVRKNSAFPPMVQQAVERDAAGGNKSSSSLISYIFLTNKGSGEPLIINNDKNKGFDVENMSGPWICSVCDEVNPLNFDSYFTYRKHLVEVHELKIDVRICEYCGLKNSKRNHLFYHMYTKHGIDPPAYVSFPKCSECEYVALSDALLLKHKSTHDVKGLSCNICNVVFKSYTSMQSHVLSAYHLEKKAESEKREWKQTYRCPYCEGVFENGDSLKKHVVSDHWGRNIQVQNEGPKVEVYQPQSGQQLQYGEDEGVSQEGETEGTHSTELESLSNVASGIATSLNLVGDDQNVVYYEQRTEGQDIGREATVIEGNECKDYVIATSVEDEMSRHCQAASDNCDISSVKNEDSNSMTLNVEEVNSISRSDHDYSEPHSGEGLAQVITVQQVGNQMTENPVIQQVLPDQRLVFSNQRNVVFQSPCVSIPQRVLFAPGIAQGEQKIILSQVIPQTRFILSSPILQQSGNISMEGGNTAIVFANPETADQIENIQAAAMQYPLETAENVVVQNEQVQEDHMVETVDVVGESQVENNVEVSDESSIKVEEKSEALEVFEGSSEVTENVAVAQPEESSEPSNAEAEEPKAGTRVETAKIVDDWDESNENQSNVECRSDGPSRPEFF